MAVRRVRRSPARRSSPAIAAGSYQRSRAAIGLALFALIFAAGWVINGTLTVDTVGRLGGSTSWGWTIHIILSAVELLPVVLAPFLRGAPRWLIATIWLISLLLGGFDVLSSALAISTWLSQAIESGLLLRGISTFLAEILAFSPEPMLYWLVILLHRTIRS